LGSAQATEPAFIVESVGVITSPSCPVYQRFCQLSQCDDRQPVIPSTFVFLPALRRQRDDTLTMGRGGESLRPMSTHMAWLSMNYLRGFSRLDIAVNGGLGRRFDPVFAPG
jgi:hypothetical protein